MYKIEIEKNANKRGAGDDERPRPVNAYRVYYRYRSVLHKNGQGGRNVILYGGSLTFEYRILELDVGVGCWRRGCVVRRRRQQHGGPRLVVRVYVRHQRVPRTVHPFTYGAPVLLLPGRVLVGHVPLQTRFRAQHFAASQAREHLFQS